MSNKIGATASCREYPDDGKDYRTVRVTPHWNYDDRLNIEILPATDGARPCVILIRDLKRAIAVVEAAHD